jgi:hypothetical protein
MQMTPVIFWLAMFVLDYYILIEPVNPEIAGYLFLPAVVAVPLTLSLAQSYRKTERQYIDSLRNEADKIQEVMPVLLQKMIIGMGLAEFPACMSISYYFFSCDLPWATVLALTSFALGFLFKPSLPGISMP